MASRTAVWGWLTDPARMNQWSTARIEPTDPGELGRMDGVEANRVLAMQRASAERLRRANDPKQWFARVYVFVTEEQLAHLDRGEVDHPEWALRLIPAFHTYYSAALEGFERSAAIDPAWQK